MPVLATAMDMSAHRPKVAEKFRLFAYKSYRKLWFKIKNVRCAGANISSSGRLWIHGGGSIEIGDNTCLDGGNIGIELDVERGARLTIGSHCVIGSGSSIEARDHVSLGDRVILETSVKIMDNNFHPLEGDRHARPPSRPVRIDNDVHIGARAIILPGVHIECGARVEAGSVVNRSVKANMVVAGNPARRKV